MIRGSEIPLGLRVGKLTVMSRRTATHGHTMLLCKCDCGRTCSVRSDHLRNMRTRSCPRCARGERRPKFNVHLSEKVHVSAPWRAHPFIQVLVHKVDITGTERSIRFLTAGMRDGFLRQQRIDRKNNARSAEVLKRLGLAPRPHKGG